LEKASAGLNSIFEYWKNQNFAITVTHINCIPRGNSIFFTQLRWYNDLAFYGYLGMHDVILLFLNKDTVTLSVYL